MDLHGLGTGGRPTVTAAFSAGDLYGFHHKCPACSRHSGAVRDDERRMPRLSSELLPVYDGLDLVFRWLMTNVLPPEPHRPQSLQRTACACSDDIAFAIGSLRESLPIVADAFTCVDHVTGMSLNYRKCHWNDLAACGMGGHPCTCVLANAVQ